MKRRTILEIAAGLVLVVAAFGAGTYFGASRMEKVLGEALSMEVSAGTQFRIDELLYLRSGRTERAIPLLEMQVDAALTNVTGNRRARGISWEDLSREERRALLLAKLYRQRYPPQKPDPYLQAAMEWIPDEKIDWGSCMPPTREAFGEKPKS
jgi:hypothetical protein